MAPTGPTPATAASIEGSAPTPTCARSASTLPCDEALRAAETNPDAFLVREPDRAAEAVLERGLRLRRRQRGHGRRGNLARRRAGAHDAQHRRHRLVRRSRLRDRRHRGGLGPIALVLRRDPQPHRRMTTVEPAFERPQLGAAHVDEHAHVARFARTRDALGLEHRGGVVAAAGEFREPGVDRVFDDPERQAHGEKLARPLDGAQRFELRIERLERVIGERLLHARARRRREDRRRLRSRWGRSRCRAPQLVAHAPRTLSARRP